jgi:hypothetical protein
MKDMITYNYKKAFNKFRTWRDSKLPSLVLSAIWSGVGLGVEWD